MKADYDIVIAGAGPVGLAMALALSQASDRSLKIALCDPSLGARKNLGRISALAPASSNLLMALGAWDELQPLAQAIEGMQISDSRPRDSIRLPLLSFDSEPAEGPIAHILANADIERVLTQWVEDSGVALIAAEAMAMDTHTGLAELRFAMREPLYARLIIAADGRRSRLRRIAGLTTIGWDYPISGIVATIGHERDHEGIARQHFLPAGPFAALPMTQQRSSIVWCEPHLRAQHLITGAADEFMQELETRFGFELGHIELLDQPVAYPLSLQLGRSLHAERLVLLGDAAHVIPAIADKNTFAVQMTTIFSRIAMPTGDVFNLLREGHGQFAAGINHAKQHIGQPAAHGLSSVESFHHRGHLVHHDHDHDVDDASHDDIYHVHDNDDEKIYMSHLDPNIVQ